MRSRSVHFVGKTRSRQAQRHQYSAEDHRRAGFQTRGRDAVIQQQRTAKRERHRQNNTKVPQHRLHCFFLSLLEGGKKLFGFAGGKLSDLGAGIRLLHLCAAKTARRLRDIDSRLLHYGHRAPAVFARATIHLYVAHKKNLTSPQIIGKRRSAETELLLLAWKTNQITKSQVITVLTPGPRKNVLRDETVPRLPSAKALPRKRIHGPAHSHGDQQEKDKRPRRVFRALHRTPPPQHPEGDGNNQREEQHRLQMREMKNRRQVHALRPRAASYACSAASRFSTPAVARNRVP